MEQTNNNRELIYTPKTLQRELHLLMDSHRFGTFICHRRFGKSMCSINHLIFSALRCPLYQPRVAYIAPDYRRAKRIAWDYLKKYTKLYGGKPNESELRVDLPEIKDNGGARVRLYGCDDPDSIKGVYFDCAIFDEFDEIPERAWTEVVSPLLSDRCGRCYFTGTPRGKQNLWKYSQVAKTEKDWFTRIYPVTETDVIAPEEIVRLKRMVELGLMSQAEYDQEHMCAFNAAMVGGYWTHEFSKARKEGRISSIMVNPNIPVHTGWDLGIGTANQTAIWFFQICNGRVRFINYYESQGVGLLHYVKVLAGLGYKYGKHYAPHDIQVRDLGTGKTRFEQAAEMGLMFTVVPRVNDKNDSIEAGRLLINVSEFDQTSCEKGLGYLEAYRRQWSEKRGIWQSSPYHNAASNAADAFQQVAMGIDKSVLNYESILLERAETDKNDWGWGGRPGKW